MTEHGQTGQTVRRWVLLLLLVVTAAVIASKGSIAQDGCYHYFADHRALLGIPSCLDVISNAPFLLVGLYGIPSVRRLLRSEQRLLEVLPDILFVTGVLLTAFGSAWYHLAPDDDRLVVDRLPMTLAFTGLSAALIDEHFFDGSRPLLAVLLPALGVLSVLVWNPLGHGLGFYYFAQGLPMIVVLLVLLLVWEREQARREALRKQKLLLGASLVLYLAAKVAEAGDRFVFDLGRHVSGHSVKHLLAAAASLAIVLMIRQNSLTPAGTPRRSA